MSMVNENEKVPAADVRRWILWGAKILSYFVYVYLILVEIVLLIGFFLLLFGANPTAGFTQWAYRNLDRVMAPFRGIFTPISLGSTTADVPAIFDTSVLFAMIVYGILALLMSWVIHWLTDRLMRLDRSRPTSSGASTSRPSARRSPPGPRTRSRRTER